MRLQNSPAAAPHARYGILCGSAAYGMWGLIPLYFKAVNRVPPVEVLAHRALWSFVVLVLVLSVLRRWNGLWETLRAGRRALLLVLSSALIAANWLTFIYAVLSNQVAEASLGYFINPLVSVLFGALFLGERLRPYQMLSLALAVAGVTARAAMLGTLPWIAVALPVSFGLYGLVRKINPVDSLVSLAVETMMLSPLALGYLVYLGATRQATGTALPMLGLLMLGGPVTTVPLLFFGAAARRLRLSTLGILQYITPSMTFVLAVVFFREPFSRWHLVSFACIWTALALYTADSLRAARQVRLDLIEPLD